MILIVLIITFTFNHLADAFIQSDVQMRRIEAIRPSREQQYTSLSLSSTVHVARFFFIIIIHTIEYNR